MSSTPDAAAAAPVARAAVADSAKSMSGLQDTSTSSLGGIDAAFWRSRSMLRDTARAATVPMRRGAAAKQAKAVIEPAARVGVPATKLMADIVGGRLLLRAIGARDVVVGRPIMKAEVELRPRSARRTERSIVFVSFFLCWRVWTAFRSGENNE